MSNGHGEKKDRTKEKAIVALLTEPTVKQAAEKAGIGVATLFRWMNDTEFDAQYQEAKNLAFSQAINRLQQSTGKAVDTLNTVMDDADAPPASRVSAAKTILELGIKVREQDEFEKRISELEKLQETNRLKGAR